MRLKKKKKKKEKVWAGSGYTVNALFIVKIKFFGLSQVPCSVKS